MPAVRPGPSAKVGLESAVADRARLQLVLLLHLAGHHPGLEYAPHQLLTGASHVGVGLASTVAEPGYAKKLNEVLVVQVQLRLSSLEPGIYSVAEPFGALLFVHPASPVLPRFQDSTARPQSSVNVRGHRV